MGTERRLEHHLLEQYRVELTGSCYRMLGSGFEAEDAVQDTLVRAWRNIDRFDEDRAPMRSWLYTIATNVCLDMLRSTQRRAGAMDLGPASYPGAALGAPLPETAWVQPVPDGRVNVEPERGDPAELAAQRDSIRLAFVAALQHLPPRQRAVLILRDVLCWTAAEVARLLDTTVASVNSALQRSRSTLETVDIPRAEPFRPMDDAQRTLLARYCDAFERYDVETLVALLHEDATMSMPPFAWWLRGRTDVGRVLHAAGNPCEGARLVPTVANGSPAFGQYRPSGPDGGYDAFALVVLEVADGLITETTTYLDPGRLFPLFGLPVRAETVPGSVSGSVSGQFPGRPMSFGGPRRRRGMADYVTANDLLMWYDEHGTGDPLVLLHGGLTDTRDFAGNLDTLAERFTLFLPERRGHGHTADVPGPITVDLMARDTIAFLNKVVGGPAYLVGYSAGATVALRVAGLRPDLVERLVLVSAAFDSAGTILRPVADAEPPPRLVAAYAEVSPDGADHFAVVVGKVARAIEEEPGLTPADLSAVTAPTLVMAGDDDLVTLEHTVALYRGLRDAQLAVVPGTSHLLLFEKPELCTGLVTEFVTTEPVPTMMPIRRAQLT